MGMFFIEDLFLKFMISAISWFWEFQVAYYITPQQFQIGMPQTSIETPTVSLSIYCRIGMLTLPVSNSPREDDHLIIRGSL